MRTFLAVGLGLLTIAVSGPCFAACNVVSTYTDGPSTGGTFGDASDRPARVCAVEFIANGSNGFAQVFDSPDDTLTHGQAVTVSEPGAATANNAEGRWYGDGRLTRFGLDVLVFNGRVIIQWHPE